jgi:hypothetical protein
VQVDQVRQATVSRTRDGVMNRSMRSSSRSGLIRLIAVFKLLKAIVLIVVGVGILKLIHNKRGERAGTLGRDARLRSRQPVRRSRTSERR